MDEKLNYSKLLGEIVLYGQLLLKKESEKDNSLSVLPYVLLLRRFLEIMDSISIQIENSGSYVLTMLLRTQVECFFYIQFLLQNETMRECEAFTYWQLKELEKFYKKLDPNSQLGKEFASKDKNESINNARIDYDQHEANARLIDISNRLSSERYDQLRAIEEEFKTEKVKKPEWYQLLHKEVSNLEKLASHLKMDNYYQVNYRQNSRSIHHNDIFEGTFSEETSNSSIMLVDLRDNIVANDCAIESSHFGLELISEIIQKRWPDEIDNFNDWFNNQIKPTRDSYLK